MPPYATDDHSLARDTDIEFIRDSGPGGQHRNKVETGVRLHHRPSGMVIKEARRRSQARNREVAFARLRERLLTLNRPPRRRIPTTVPRGEKRKRVEAKKQRSQVKKLRRAPSPDE
ncbi:MAG: peptidyl-tRNA hydrolase [Dehalococcoidia bacterium]|nr:peptidyl-tRNA hydrolase [Dehalococcoidia bacterium]